MTKGRRKKRAWLIGSLVGLIALALIVAVVVFFTSKERRRNDLSSAARTGLPGGLRATALALEDYLDGKMNSVPFNATWISGTELIYRDEPGNIVIYHVNKNATEIVLDADSPILSTAFDFEISPDHKYILIAHDYQKVFRHSYFAQYTIVDIVTKDTSPVATSPGGDVILQYATWAPAGNAVVFVAKNNVYYRTSATSPDTIAVTTDGALGHVYNGIPDWVYEEEVLSSNKAVWISPDTKKLAYAKFNDTLVPIMTIPFYGPPGNAEFQFPKAIQLRYPKPGTKNPDVSLYVVDLETNRQLILQPPPRLTPEAILASVAWATSDIVTAVWMNRVQNEAEIITYNTKDSAESRTESIRKIKEPKGWLELFTPPKYSKDGSKMIIILSQDQGNNTGGYRHIALLSRQRDSVVQPLTSGTFVVTEILAWDEEKDLVYYQATSESDPAVQHIYAVSTSSKSAPSCLSCSAVTDAQNTTKCLHNAAAFSSDHSHYVLQCLGPAVPEIAVYSINNSKLVVWEDNKEIQQLVSTKEIPKIKRMTFPVGNGDFEAQVMLKLPPGIDFSGDTKYPMLINVYGGPDSLQVLEKFTLDWGSYLAANKSIIYGFIDGRGSGQKGDKMLFSGYRNLGTVEIVDQVNVTRQIQQALPFVDASRTAIWGWSYGGYASGMALASDVDDVFKCGISVAPVTDWALYDSIYTERFMGLPFPQDNLKGYVNAQLLNKFEGFRDKQYYLIHGTLDDNVHYQQSMVWSRILEQQDILFNQQSYPDEDHSLATVRHHLYHSLEHFLDECFAVQTKN